MAAKRSIFQEVSDTTARAPVQPGGIDAHPKGARGAVRAWLGLIFVLLLAMIAIGGMTRLTDSGLSITVWKPVTGAIPPLSLSDWEAEFALYRATPQYQLLNRGMSLEAFKEIYWWEWGHRQLGRVIGLVWGIGFMLFWARGQIPPGWTRRLLGLGALGGLQGAVGWWMVASGLSGQMVSVASYRLAVHLGLAFLILGLIAAYMFELSRSEAALMQARRAAERKLAAMTTGLMHLAFVQILLGALVAGIDAGRGYIDWPLMGGEVFPTGAFALVPGWSNFFENPALVQFNHRLLGYALFGFGLVVWWRARNSSHRATRRAFGWMAVALSGQAVLGVVTVLYAAPMLLGLSHQLGAVVLWVLIIRARGLALAPIRQSIRGT